MGSWCAFGYSSGLFIQYLLLMSFIIGAAGRPTEDFYVRFGQLSYHLFEKEKQAGVHACTI